MTMNIESQLEDDWESFLVGGESNSGEDICDNRDIMGVVPKSTSLYISTKTKILFMNSLVDLKEVFWNLPIIPYATPQNGIIKKQMKLNSTSQEEVEFIEEQKKKYMCVSEKILFNSSHVHSRENVFKDVRKVSIGISKKDIMSYRSKEKSAFYNCFVINIRILHKDIYKEVHVKVFNTGKLEIPGIQCETFFGRAKQEILRILQPHFSETILSFDTAREENVLVNSNFHCGYYINRDKLFDILKYKYNIQASYDPCSYPGIQCKYIKPGGEGHVSFMIFRTGSVLVVGKCDDVMLNVVYNFLTKLLHDEYTSVVTIQDKEDKKKQKPKKQRKKTIYFTPVKQESNV